MIVDTFLYNGEADMLELRLHELSEVVDHVVIVEGCETFTGYGKRLTWVDDRRESRFTEFADRITYHVPPAMSRRASAWERESQQRNAIATALTYVGAPDDALILVSDVDEIPKASCVARVRDEPYLHGKQVAFEQTVYFYHPQCLNLLTWYGTRAIRYGDMTMPQALRATEWVLPGESVITWAGWHFSYFMSPEAIQRKLAAYSHTEVNQPPYNTLENIEAAMIECRSLVPTDGQKFRRVTPTDLPAYMLANAERYGLVREAVAV